MDIAAFAKEFVKETKDAKALDAKRVESLLAHAVAATVAAQPPRFGEPTITVVDTDASYADKFGDAGARSTKMLEVTVPLPASGLKVKATIYAKLARKADGDEITYHAALPAKQAVTGIDKDAKEQFLAFVELAASQWPGWNKASEAADARLLGTKLPAKGAGPVLERPRLVKTVKVAAASNQPAA